jgi:hypothetical protein
MSLSCRLCGEPTTSDNYLIGKRADKNILLDIYTDKPFDCIGWRSQQEARHRRLTQYYQYNKGCSQCIRSDAYHQNELTVGRKRIQLCKNTGEQYQCQ